MNKITKKLVLHFMVVALVLSAVAFIGYYGTFKQYSLQHHREELQTRAEMIRERMEMFVNSCTQNQELSSYIKVLDDISLADAYFVTKNGDSFSCSCSCGTTVAIEKKPTDKVDEFADKIFESGTYKEYEIQEDSKTIFYIGIPVKEEGETTAVVVIVDAFDLDQKNFIPAITILFVCLFVALIVSTVIAMLLAKRFMIPIQKIAATTKELIKGNYRTKTEVNDENEIGILAKETDMLAERLASVEQMQKDYFASISHELRTPVTVIRSSLEALHDGVVPEEKVPEYRKQMILETISLQRLVNDMLELARLENEEFIIEKQEIDLLQVLEDAIRSVRVVAREKRITIQYESLLEEWPVLGDYGRLKQMFITVLDNAVKYSEAEKYIWIEAKQKGDNYYISIRDEGRGMSEEQQKHIYDKFYRSSDEASTGLGLVVMKNIAKRHDIEVRLHSEVCKGTKIIFITSVYKRKEKNDN